MLKKQFPATAPKFALLGQFAEIVQTGGDREISKALLDLQCSPLFQGVAWQTNFAKLADVFASKSALYTVFTEGNGKLPFYSFSTLPGVTCPGAGACLTYCYSYKAWRYPAAFARQVQNAYLMRFGKLAIHSALDALTKAKPEGFDMRLYVDGDFSSIEDVSFWMAEFNAYPMIKGYGYSKSFAILLGFDTALGLHGGKWPSNYMLNISSGHNASAEMVSYVKALPITRGEFIAVDIGHKVKSSDYGTKATNDAIRKAMGTTKVFPCPGQCGSCTGKGHACGMDAFKGKVIAIAVH
jgi:hypothetical protein